MSKELLDIYTGYLISQFALKYKLILKVNQIAFNELKTLREKVGLA